MHDAVNPEYSILKQRIARRLRHEGGTDESVKQLTLSELFLKQKEYVLFYFIFAYLSLHSAPCP